MSTWETLEQDVISQQGPLSRARYSNKCKFALFLENLDSEDRYYVQSAMDNPKIPGRPLYRAMISRGMDCRQTVFKEHRACKCICFLEKD